MSVYACCECGFMSYFPNVMDDHLRLTGHGGQERGAGDTFRGVRLTTREDARRNTHVPGRPHRCPVCEGRGSMPHDFYTRLGVGASTETVKCRSCDGKGLVWS